MEEAERLCQRIAIMDHGKVIAQDTPRKLIDRLGGGILQIGLASADETICQQVSGLTHVRAATFLPPDIGDEIDLTSPERAILKVEVQQPEPALIEIIQLFNQLNINILSIETLEPNLESLFLHLTGKSLRD
jgi:ABC-2 type transport system ATP-binding protein